MSSIADKDRNGENKKLLIDRVLNRYPKPRTVGVYRAGIYDFFDCLYGRVRKARRVTAEERILYEELAVRYFNEAHDRFEDFLTFIAAMNGKPPVGAKAKIAGVKEFLVANDVEFTQRQLKTIRTKMPKGKTARTAEKEIELDTLRRILNHMDIKGRAMVLVLASSGMRIGELMQVKLQDVDLRTAPAEIIVRGEYTKSGDTRTVFISAEAAEAVAEWLPLRNKYLVSARNKNRGLVTKAEAREKSVEDDRVFPFSIRNVRMIWENALKKARLWNKDDSTGRSQVRIHALRKLFRSQIALSCPIDIVEALMGHEGYLTEAYRRYTRRQMGEYYLKAERHITVSGSGDFSEMRSRLEETRMTVKGYKDRIAEQDEELAVLKEKVEGLEAWKTGIEHYNDKLTKLLRTIIDDKVILGELAKKGVDLKLTIND